MLKHTLILPVFLALANIACGDDAEYDLRGPGPAKGQVFVTKSSTVIKDAAMTFTVNEMTIKLTQNLTAKTEEELEILEVKGRDVTKCQTKVVKDNTVTKLNGEGKEEKTGELEGEIIITEQTKDGKWKHKLVDTKATELQQKELNRRSGPDNDDDLFPEKKVKIGHTWTVDASKLKSLTGNHITEVKGKMNQKFLRVEKVEDDECAVIETSGTLTGKMADDDGGNPDVTLKIVATSWRSLKLGYEVKGTVKGTIKLEGPVKMEMLEAKMLMEGPIEIKQTTTIKKD